jgi:hypothetical protein
VNGVDSKLSTKASLNPEKTHSVLLQSSLQFDRESSFKDYNTKEFSLFGECIEEDEDEYRQQSWQGSRTFHQIETMDSIIEEMGFDSLPDTKLHPKLEFSMKNNIRPSIYKQKFMIPEGPSLENFTFDQ